MSLANNHLPLACNTNGYISKPVLIPSYTYSPGSHRTPKLSKKGEKRDKVRQENLKPVTRLD